MTSAVRLAGRLSPRHVAPAVMATAVVLFTVAGRHQWFTRDDWAFLLTRRAMREQLGVTDWLLTAQDGHWMTPPLLVYWAVEAMFGIGSYAPFLVVNLALHVAAVTGIAVLCRRCGVRDWTTLLVCSLLLVFGSGWENLLFAVQVTYNLSLVAFVAHLLLVDHDGPIGRRDVLGAVVGIVGVSSSAFGPFFGAAIFVVLVWRRRRRAALVAAIPQGVLYLWWLVTWGSDPAGARGDASVVGAAKFARLALTATLNGMTGQVIFAGAALFGIVAVVFATPLSTRQRSLVTVLAVTPLPVLLAIGWQRATFGLDSAASPRYQYMTAMVLAVPFALAIDQLRRVHPRGVQVGALLVAIAAVSNARLLVDAGNGWADRSSRARDVFELVAGAPEAATADGGLVLVAFDPDVTVGWLPYLARHGAIDPRPPSTVDERALVTRVLLGTPEP
ncbi:MAG: hypothetical protein KDB40_09875 [Acidimicrobiales bacterium]|nr:hypothetical protein [Acidimicrobiales bacterium]